jgi:kanamycin kinase
MIRTQISFDANTFPASLGQYVNNAKIYDSSCSKSAHTLYLEGDVKAFLKMAAAGKLLREKLMTDFMHSQGLAAKVLDYFSDESGDYLMTEALGGEDGIAEHHLADPQRLAACFGEYLQMIHRLPVHDCPFPGRTAEMIAESEANIRRKYVDKSILLEDISRAEQDFNHLKHCGKDDVVIHGDYCLPNIIMQNFRLSGFVDLGTGGVGDRHYDLFWGIWTLQYNLKTDKYRTIFLDAYGRQQIDPLRLRLCHLLAGFTE